MRRPGRSRTIIVGAGIVAATAATVTMFVAIAGVRMRAAARRSLPSGHRLRSPPRQTSTLARNARLIGVGGRAGTGYALHRARRRFASAERREELDTDNQLATTAQVVDALGDMKGALMKLGQMVSYLAPGLPEPVRDALAQLQHDAPPMSPELAAEVVADELGAPPGEVFAEWDPVPIAAASIGQVHRAMTHGGEAVAVKVQYPGVAEAIRSDLTSAAALLRGVALQYPGLDPGPLVAELRTRVAEELDYRREAEHQRMFASYFAGHPFIHVPAVFDEYSTGRVLVSELDDGVRFAEMAQWPQSERDLAGETIFRFVFTGIYRLHRFNGDPHPGNYLFHPGGRVTFVDFGLCKVFEPAEVDQLQALVDAYVVRPDAARFRAVMEDIGFLEPGAPVSDDEVQAFFRQFYALISEPGSITVGSDYADETARVFFDTSTPEGRMLQYTNVPPEFAVIQRINLGLYGVLAQLEATAPWRAISEEIWPWVDAEPSTQLGRADATWRADRSARDGRGTEGSDR